MMTIRTTNVVQLPDTGTFVRVDVADSADPAEATERILLDVRIIQEHASFSTLQTLALERARDVLSAELDALQRSTPCHGSADPNGGA